MFVIAANPTVTALAAYYIGRAAHNHIRSWSDGSTHLGCARTYETQEQADADFARCPDSIKRRMAVRPATAREAVYLRLGARFDRFMRSADWTAAGDALFNRRRDRIRGRVA